MYGGGGFYMLRTEKKLWYFYVFILLVTQWLCGFAFLPSGGYNYALGSILLGVWASTGQDPTNSFFSAIQATVMESKGAMLHSLNLWLTKRSNTHKYQIFIFASKIACCIYIISINKILCYISLCYVNKNAFDLALHLASPPVNRGVISWMARRGPWCIFQFRNANLKLLSEECLNLRYWMRPFSCICFTQCIVAWRMVAFLYIKVLKDN